MAKEPSTTQPVDDDRISNLPKPVLLHILSFLSTKQASATSVLSKPWQYLWTWVPDLDISDFCGDDAHSFVHVIFQIFRSRREWCIRKLRLSFHFYCDVDTLHNILCTAVERNVEELHMYLSCFSVDEVFELPRSLFSCKTLVVLRLEGDIAINFGCPAHLPSLEVLHLKRVRYKDEDTFSNLLSACPVLEELLLRLSESVTTDNCLYYEISSPTIKYLALAFHGFGSPCLSNVSVNAPALKYFTIDNGFGPNVLLSNDSTEIKELEDEFAILKEKYRRECKKTKKNAALLKIMYQQMRNTNPDMPAFESSSDSDD